MFKTLSPSSQTGLELLLLLDELLNDDFDFFVLAMVVLPADVQVVVVDGVAFCGSLWPMSIFPALSSGTFKMSQAVLIVSHMRDDGGYLGVVATLGLLLLLFDRDGPNSFIKEADEASAVRVSARCLE